MMDTSPMTTWLLCSPKSPLADAVYNNASIINSTVSTLTRLAVCYVSTSTRLVVICLA